MGNTVVIRTKDEPRRWPTILYVDTDYGRMEADMEPPEAEIDEFVRWSSTVAKGLLDAGQSLSSTKLTYADFKKAVA